MQDQPNTLKVRGGNVTGNSVQSNGGGIYGDNMNLADFTGVRFQDNIAGIGELPTPALLRELCCAVFRLSRGQTRAAVSTELPEPSRLGCCPCSFHWPPE